MKIVKMAQSGYTKIYSLLVSLAASILTLTETGGTITSSAIEQAVYINNAPAGVYSPKTIMIDFTNQTATEIVVIREYYRLKAATGAIKIDEVTFAGVQDPLLKEISLKQNRFGILVSLQKTAGTARDYNYEVFYKV